MRQRAAASLLYQSKYAEAAFRNLLKLIFLKIVGRILAFYSEGFLHLPQVCLPVTPELTELDFRFLLLLSENSTIC